MVYNGFYVDLEKCIRWELSTANWNHVNRGPLNYEPAKEKPHFQLGELVYKSQSEMNRNLYFEIDTVLFILSYGNSRKSFMHYAEFNDTCLSPLMLSCLYFL